MGRGFKKYADCFKHGSDKCPMANLEPDCWIWPALYRTSGATTFYSSSRGSYTLIPPLTFLWTICECPSVRYAFSIAFICISNIGDDGNPASHVRNINSLCPLFLHILLMFSLLWATATSRDGSTVRGEEEEEAGMVRLWASQPTANRRLSLIYSVLYHSVYNCIWKKKNPTAKYNSISCIIYIIILFII